MKLTLWGTEVLEIATITFPFVSTAIAWPISSRLFGPLKRADQSWLPFGSYLSVTASKEELALKVKEYVPNFYLHFSEIGTDPDKRNYIVSNQRLREAGFEAKRTLDEGIRELIKGYKMLGRARFKNV